MNVKTKHFEDLESKHPKYFRVLQKLPIETQQGIDHQILFELGDLNYIDAGNSLSLPVLGLFAGVHGIESIGVQILHRFLDYLLEQTKWNSQLRTLLRQLRIVGIPIVNPAGYVARSRCNGRGVDLMRNAPITSKFAPPFLGGQTLTDKLPYFRGRHGLEPENVGLIGAVRREMFDAPFSLSLDLHSGFGLADFLWTPWAKEKGPPPSWTDYLVLKGVLDSTLRHHVYKFEQQSESYCTHGDIWDFLFEEFHSESSRAGVYLPLTLEVGSWIWLRKSPANAFRMGGLFNPLEPHRQRRVLRRHLPLLDLLIHVVANFRQVFPSVGVQGSNLKVRSSGGSHG